MIRARTVFMGRGPVETRLFDVAFAPAASLVECEVFQSREGVVFGSDGAPLPFSFQSLPRRQLEADLGESVQNIFDARHESITGVDRGPWIPALVPGYWNYYHLLVDCMARVLASIDAAPAKPRLLVTAYQKQRIESLQPELLAQVLDVLGLASLVEVREGELTRVQRAIVPLGSGKLTGLAIDGFQKAARRTPSGRQRRLTYVSRGFSSARRILNEDQVIATVLEFGFDVLHLERIPVREQIGLFRESEVVLGAHGAGFANIVFANPGTILLELLQENALYKAPIFSELAGLAGADHAVIRTKGERNDRYPGHAGNMDLIVDCEELKRILSSYVCQGILGLKRRLVQEKLAPAASGLVLPKRESDGFVVEEKGPVLHLHPMGGMANRMIQYVVARRIADAIDGCRISNISLPEWNIDHPLLNSGRGDEGHLPISWNDFDIDEAISSLASGERNCVQLRTYAQWFPNFPDLDFCRSLFPANEQDYPGFGPGHLVCNLRGGEILGANFPNYVLLPVSFYAELAAKTGLRMVFIGQIEENSYCDELRMKFPDAIFQGSRGPIADFQTFRNSKNLVPAVSTFSWMAAWLSHAENIFLAVNGLFNPVQCPAVDLLPGDDSRYKFYLFPPNYSVPLDQIQAAHEQLDGCWREASIKELTSLRASIYRRPMQAFEQFLAVFDEEFYLRTSRDVARLVEQGRLASGRDHYISHGFGEGRMGFAFDAKWYRAAYPEAQQAVDRGECESLLHHYVLRGAAKGYRPRPCPILDVQLEGGFAERMVQYLVAERVRTEVEDCAISGVTFPEWGIAHPALPGDAAKSAPSARIRTKADLNRAIELLSSNANSRATLTAGDPCWSTFPSLEISRAIFPAQPEEWPGYGSADLVCYIESPDDSDLNQVLIPVDFYAELAGASGKRLVFLGQTDDNAYWRALRNRFQDAEFMPSRGQKADFQTFRNSRCLVPGVSLAAWLAAWLSYAERIDLVVDGLFHPVQQPRFDLLPLEDERYRFYLFPINYAVAPERFEEAHAALAEHWRPIERGQLDGLRTARCPRRIESYLPFFDENFYLTTYRDVASAVSSDGLKSGLEHYQLRGFREGRSGFNFNAQWFCIAYPDAAREVGNGEYLDLAHQYVMAGAARGYLPQPPRTGE